MTALERMNAAEEALAAATAERDKLENARDRLEDRANELDAQREAKAAELADRLVDIETGATASLAIDRLREEIELLAKQVVETLSARDRADEREREAEEAVAHAERDLKNAMRAVAAPLAEQAQARARAAFASFVAYQRDWLELAEAAGLPNTGSYVQHGTEDRADSLPGIARAHGINAANFGPHYSRLLTPTPLSSLRTSMTTDDGLE